MSNDELLNQLTFHAIEARRLMLGRLIFSRVGGTIAYGPLRGFRLNEQQAWGQGDLAPKLLGLYEQEVLERISAQQKTWDCVINIGAGDGYYGVGLVKSGLAQRSICFKKSSEGQAALKVSAETNQVADRVTILGHADPDFLDKPALQGLDPAHTLLIIDIEGGEFGLLTPDVLNHLRNAEIVIELHGGFFPNDPDLEFRFLALLQQYFSCEVLAMGRRDLSHVHEVAALRDNDRWLLCSESRPFLMRWVHCMPKQKAA
jgi:hypothetical protein